MKITTVTKFASAMAVILPAAAWSPTTATAQISYRPGQEFRSLNSDLYHISIQKNGRLDVVLGSGEPVFLNVFPMVWFEGEDEPERLPVDGHWSQRYQVEDPLGVGNGMLIRYKTCEWSLRAYPSKPFLAVQVSFVNTRKKPVTVSQLMPWCIGDPKKGTLTLGEGTADASILVNTPTGESSLTRGDATSGVNLAMFNPVTRRSMIAGFVTQGRARCELAVARTPKAEETAFDSMRAVCLYDPPVVVEPGDRLDSEVLYVALAELNPLVGLERYAGAMAAANRISSARRETLRGRATWEIAPSSGLTTEGLLAELDYVAEHLRPAGVSHVEIGPGWQQTADNWERNPEAFPMPFGLFTQEAHQRGMTAGIWMNPLAATTASDSGLDQLGARVRAWGFDAVAGLDPVPVSTGAQSTAMGPTPMLQDRNLIESFRAGFGLDGFLIAATPRPPTALALDGMVIDAGRGAELGPTLADATRRYYLGGRVIIPEYRLPANLSELGPDELRRHLTAAAMFGASLRLRSDEARPSGETLAALGRVVPAMHRAGRPADLFSSDPPRVWVKHASSAAGMSHVVSVFNWNVDAVERTTLPFASLGLDPGTYYTVYDFWKGMYRGVARQSISVDVAAGGVRVLVLRPYENHPQVAGSPTHISQEMPQLQALDWDPKNQTLSGTVGGDQDTQLTLDIRVPDGFEFSEMVDATSVVLMNRESNLPRLQINARPPDETKWTMRFTRRDNR